MCESPVDYPRVDTVAVGSSGLSGGKGPSSAGQEHEGSVMLLVWRGVRPELGMGCPLSTCTYSLLTTLQAKSWMQ